MNFREIRATATAFQKSRILLTAYELDIFTFIGENNFNSETEVSTWLKYAGFIDIEKVELEEGLAQMIGKKK